MSERNPFSPAIIIGLVVAGIVSFAAFVLLLAYGGDGGARNRERATAVSRSAIGFQALFDLTSRYHATELLRNEMLLDTTDLVVVSLEPTNTRAEVQALLRRRARLPTVLILPKWAVQADPDRRGWVRSIGPFLARDGARLLGDVAVETLSSPSKRDRIIAGQGMLEGISVPLPNAAQVVHGENVEPLVGIPGEGALVAQLGARPHYVIADPDLVNNHGLRDPRVARAALRMLLQFRPSYEDDAVRFDLTVNGVGNGRSLLRIMFEPPFLALTLALLAAALLAGYHGAVRFGPTRRPVRAIPFGKAALVENSAGLVRLARREVRLGRGYADVIRDDAGRAGAAPPTLRDAELESYLDRFTRPGGQPFSELANAVRSARDRGELVAAARALFAWKKDMIR